MTHDPLGDDMRAHGAEPCPHCKELVFPQSLKLHLDNYCDAARRHREKMEALWRERYPKCRGENPTEWLAFEVRR